MKYLHLSLLLMTTIGLADPSVPLTAGQWVIVNNTNCHMTVGYTVIQPDPSRQAQFGKLNLTAMSSNIANPLRTPFIYKPSNFGPIQTFNINTVTLCNITQPINPASCSGSYTPAMTKTFVFTLTSILGATQVSCNVSAF